jgi:hypothetical protein
MACYFFCVISGYDIWWFGKKCLPLHLNKKKVQNIDIYEQEICRTQRLEFDADEQ